MCHSISKAVCWTGYTVQLHTPGHGSVGRYPPLWNSWRREPRSPQESVGGMAYLLPIRVLSTTTHRCSRKYFQTSVGGDNCTGCYDSGRILPRNRLVHIVLLNDRPRVRLTLDAVKYTRPSHHALLWMGLENRTVMTLADAGQESENERRWSMAP